MTAPNRIYEPPSDEQLIAFAAITMFGAPGMFDRSKAQVERLFKSYPPLREDWLQRHRETQEDIWRRADQVRADEEAADR
jgi:hypothetical protein